MRKTAWNLKTFVVLSKHLIHFIYGFGNDVYRSESDIFADALWVRRYCGSKSRVGSQFFSW